MHHLKKGRIIPIHLITVYISLNLYSPVQNLLHSLSVCTVMFYNILTAQNQQHVPVSPCGNISQRALQCVIVVLETFKLQKVFGPLAALASRGQVSDLDGGGSAANRRASQILGCRLVLLVQTSAAGIGLNTKKMKEEEK